MADLKDPEIDRLKHHISILESQIRSLGHEPHPADKQHHDSYKLAEIQPDSPNLPLSLDEYARYGRQMILPRFGLPCKLSIVDHDTVELSNLHRQVLHSVDTVGKPKAESARQALLRINPSIQITTHCLPLATYTLSDVFTPESKYDAVLDCSDTPSTRYLLSDITARLGIPLISGAAQRTDGQLVVYNLPANVPPNSNLDTSTAIAGPCMRCIFPSVSRTGAGAERCSDVGVLGPVVGVIGVLMALETIKVLTGFGVEECETRTPTMLLYSALSPRPFKTIKLRPRQPGCRGCSGTPLAKKRGDQTLPNVLADIKHLEDDYIEFCGDVNGTPDPVNRGMIVGEPGSRVHALDLQTALSQSLNSSGPPPNIIDTRPPTEYGICSIPGSTNIPLAQLLKNPDVHLPSQPSRTFVVCRLGNDSQIAARALRDALVARKGTSEMGDEITAHRVVDVIGGLRAWAKEVDPTFPVY
ncbi:adenylyltransferase and sulfurtransferase MOCS3/UBA4 [Ceratobasidium sp. AG-Ba]|nr:adenylyltransferase and sulfurtransferase MOCS3/UBA4 [Ceratobasidium sp. AG-Ba]